jgi:hypothetical protein
MVVLFLWNCILLLSATAAVIKAFSDSFIHVFSRRFLAVSACLLCSISSFMLKECYFKDLSPGQAVTHP